MIRDQRPAAVALEMLRASDHRRENHRPLSDPQAGERGRRAAEYAARVEELRTLAGGWPYDKSMRATLFERAIRGATIFPADH